jgi:hypothetical protein
MWDEGLANHRPSQTAADQMQWTNKTEAEKERHLQAGASPDGALEELSKNVLPTWTAQPAEVPT